MKKRPPKFHPSPYSIPFLSVLHQNKALHNFLERGQHSIVEHNIGLEYALSDEICPNMEFNPTPPPFPPLKLDPGKYEGTFWGLLTHLNFLFFFLKIELHHFSYFMTTIFRQNKNKNWKKLKSQSQILLMEERPKSYETSASKGVQLNRSLLEKFIKLKRC